MGHGVEDIVHEGSDVLGGEELLGPIGQLGLPELQKLLQVAELDELHHQEELVLIVIDFLELHDVGVRQTGQDPGFRLQLVHLVLLHHLFGEHFDCAHGVREQALGPIDLCERPLALYLHL